MQKVRDKAKLKQQRIITYFIEATNEIIKKEGISAVTIRKVADLAGYSSATLYNYFDNLSHLIFLSIMDHLKIYHDAIPAYLSKCKNSIEWYMAISKCFSDFAFSEPEVYERLFFTHSDEKLQEYTQQYYELFPEKSANDWPKPFNNIYNINNMYQRNIIMMDYCVNDGYMTKESAEDFIDISLRVYKTILQDVRSGALQKDEAMSLTMEYYFQLFHCYMSPKHYDLLESAEKNFA